MSMDGIFSTGGIKKMGVVYKKGSQIRKEYYEEHPEIDLNNIAFLGEPLRPYFKTEDDYKNFLDHVRFGKHQDKTLIQLTLIESLTDAIKHVRSK